MRILTYATFLLVVVGAFAQTTPKQGSAERKALMDAFRPKVEKALHLKVIFEVSKLKVQNGWAFMLVTPRNKDGSKIDYSKTQDAEAYKEGSMSDEACALLHKVKGKWKVVNYAVGMTDVAWEGWDVKYHAPKGIFK